MYKGRSEIAPTYAMHPQYSPQDEEEEEFDAMPDELKDHMWAAFTHKAGLGPHPGIYKGPQAKPAATPRAHQHGPAEAKKAVKARKAAKAR
jgi:hypothetical protein